ncbi:F-box domain-containing protein [Apiospora marii]|uniref:F-box domain-containing protein n=1 Tax=Apiospora marii TaxID=335849 RepID=A0ABR1R4A5_9PEZI
MRASKAPSLDVIAGQNAAAAAAAAAAMAAGGIEPTAAAAAAPTTNGEPAESTSRDSRSSSSTNSPAPADNEESDFYMANNDSQSSLGVVPNIQDMQVNDLDCLSIAASLPSEILISIFARLSTPAELFKCMLVSRRWARNVVEMLWHRPSCNSWERHMLICQTLALDQPTFAYPEFIKRLNLAALAPNVSDGSVLPLAVCSRVERLTLTNCKDLSDDGLMALVKNNPNLLALDISQDSKVNNEVSKITEASIFAIAENCRKLQGLNVSGCKNISNESMIALAESCKYIKRLKLNDCDQLNDSAILAFANNCPNILEIDLHACSNIGNEPVTALLAKGQSLRELRLASCDLIDDGAFLNLPAGRTYEHLRILDLTCCVKLTDRSVEKIVDVAPRLRNLVLAKCGNMTDSAVYAISKLGRNLHYVHLGHCRHITDEGVKRLVSSCNRIRYIDLGCCSLLTDESVVKLATLPKLKRIGLVKCSNITDASMYALAKANLRRPRRDANGHVVADYHHSSLERVHLSYCINLTIPCIMRLLNSCQKLTHLSLTGVHAFMRDDLAVFCRAAPQEFTEHQRQVFCVYSGTGVSGLRRFLNTEAEFADYHDMGAQTRRRAATATEPMPIPDVDGFDEADGVDDEDMGDGSEIAGIDEPQFNTTIPPPPPPAPPAMFLQAPLSNNPGATTASQAWPVPTTPTQSSLEQSIAVHLPPPTHQGPSTATLGLQGIVGPAPTQAGPSTASQQAQADDDDEQAG